MENYESLMNELTRLDAQKQEIMKQMYEVESQLDRIKGKRAAELYNTIRNAMCELESLDYCFEVQIWNNECGDYDWYNTSESLAFRYRHKDTVIVG